MRFPISIAQCMSCLVLSGVAADTCTRPRTTVDVRTFPSTEEFFDIMAVVGTLGLRTPASPRQNILIDWVSTKLHRMKGVEVSIRESPIVKWQTLDDKNLGGAATLSLQDSSLVNGSVPIIGAIPWTQPTNGSSVTAEMVYVPPGTNITTANVTGKIVLRDFGPTSSLPYNIIFGLAIWRSNDTERHLGTKYDRPYTGAPNRDLIDAGLAGAAGFVSMMNASREDLESYFDPHEGTHYRLPGAYVGAKEAAVLKQAAARKVKASLTVDALVAEAPQREVRAILPGQTKDTIYIVCHTDGNTWVQDNGVSALLTLARYFSRLPRSVRNKTLEFVFTTGHLGYASDTTNNLATTLDNTYDTDNTVLAIALEHMGTRELLPRGSVDGTANGQPLEFSGKGEIVLWCVGPSAHLRNASVASAQRHQLDDILVASGLSLPDPNAVPEYRSFGGIGTGFHQSLIPTTAIISGPWSLWAPQFGAAAIDFDRLRRQTLAFADLILAMNPLSKAEIAGEYLTYRERRRTGTTWAKDASPPVFAPSPVSQTS